MLDVIFFYKRCKKNNYIGKKWRNSISTRCGSISPPPEVNPRCTQSPLYTWQTGGVADNRPRAPPPRAVYTPADPVVLNGLLYKCVLKSDNALFRVAGEGEEAARSDVGGRREGGGVAETGGLLFMHLLRCQHRAETSSRASRFRRYWDKDGRRLGERAAGRNGSQNVTRTSVSIYLVHKYKNIWNRNDTWTGRL